MDLIADRFIVVRPANNTASDARDEERAIDLATGGSGRLRMTGAGDAADDRRWLLRCDDLHRLRHPVLASLVDYGVIAEGRRFEAWACGLAWSGADDAAGRAIAVARDLFTGLGMTTARTSDYRTSVGETGSVVVIPPNEAGYAQPYDERVSSDAGEPALRLVDRAELSAVAELFEVGDECRPLVIALWGPAGAGKSTTALVLARVARTHGFVPVDSRQLDVRSLPRRSLFVVDRHGGRSGLSSWLRATLRDPRPHVCLILADERPAGIDGIGLRRLSVDALMSAVRPASARHEPSNGVQKAAEH